MLRWFLLGQRHDREMADFFAGQLSSRFTVTVVYESRAYVKGRGENMLISSLPLLHQCPAEGALGIMLPQGGVPLCIPKNIPFLVSSDNESQLSFLAEKGLRGYSCGLSSKDTFTFSSRDDTAASIALMREVADVYGNIVEPMEIALKTPPSLPDFTLLSYGAALILSGLS